MRKLLLLLMLLSPNLYAQLTLEQTYNSDLSWIWIDGTYKYETTLNSETGEIKYYNMDHTLFKTIMVLIDSSLEVNYISYLSSKLFDTDTGLEYITSYYNFQEGKAIFKVLNEDGSVIFESDSTSQWGLLSTPPTTKMIINIRLDDTFENYRSEVYSLPGSLASEPEFKISRTFANPFPNPSSGNITLPYLLSSGTGTLTVYSSSGQIIRTMDIGSDFKEILLETDNLSPGVYTYVVSDANGSSQGKSFVVR